MLPSPRRAGPERAPGGARSGPRRRGTLPVSLLCAAVLAGGCNSAQLDTLEYKLNDIQRQLHQLQLDTARQEALELLQQEIAAELGRFADAQAGLVAGLEGLGERIAELRAELDRSSGGVEALREQVARAGQSLADLEEAFASLELPAESSEGAPSPALDPQELYRRAYDDFLRGDYDRAIVGFRDYIDRFPNSELADNATYWIGESYFSQGRFREAIDSFVQVPSSYPNSERIASSLLREGTAHLELGQVEQARRSLLAVVERFPQSDEAILARQQLDRLPS
jgi:tol-pal system protein YbgF